MWEPLVVSAADQLIPIRLIDRIDISKIEQGEVTVFSAGAEYVARGFDAIEVVMALKPSALEGRRLKWKRGAWAFHNVVGHPAMQLLAWMRLYKAAMWLHDVTTPTPRGFKA
jgi:hypothetical protein